MLDVDHDRARKLRAPPVVVERVAVLLKNPLVSVLCAELTLMAVRTVFGQAFEVGRRQRRIRRRFAPRKHLALKVAVKDRHRIPRLRMGVPALGQHENRAEVHRTTPELRQALALNPDPPDVLRFWKLGQRRDLAIE
jgi:hypothetical protein